MTNIDTLPENLKSYPYFCTYRLIERGGKLTKLPFDARTGETAKSNDRTTFHSFEECKVVENRYDGLGVGLFNGLCAIDIDHCVEDGKPNQFAEEIIGRMQSYTELSPSGTGLHILFAVHPKSFNYNSNQFYMNNRTLGLEVYISGSTNRFLTITGNRLNSYDITYRDTELLNLLHDYMKKPEERNSTVGDANTCIPSASDDFIISKIQRSRQAYKFAKFMSGDFTGYSSQSEADLACCNMLAFWFGRNPEAIDRIFRQSGLYRQKWDIVHGGTTYGQATINKAVADCQRVYEPVQAYNIKIGMVM